MRTSRFYPIALALLLGFVFPSAHGESPVVRVETNVGAFTLQLNKDKAPITVANFLTYVNEGFYSNVLFHRSENSSTGSSIFVIQGGGFDATSFQQKAPHSPIKNEASNGLSNIRGTIAMARTNEVDSATAQFYINTADNSRALDFGAQPSNPAGYAVFGKVVEGIETVDAIQALPIYRYTAPTKTTFPTIPAVDPTNRTFVRIQNVSVLLPTANAGRDFTAESGSPLSLNGTASSDATPGTTGVLTYQWTQTAGPTVTLAGADTATPSFSAPAVTADTVFSFQLKVTNSLGNSSANGATVNVTVKAPVVAQPDPNRLNCGSATANPSTLWPPNKKMKPVSIQGIGGSKPFSVQITQITSDEPVVNKAGKDTSGPDAKIRKGNVKLRAERQFNKKKPLASFNGRVYTIVFSANDGTDSCIGTVKVGVPLENGGTPVDDGLVHDATKRR